MTAFAKGVVGRSPGQERQDQNHLLEPAHPRDRLIQAWASNIGYMAAILIVVAPAQTSAIFILQCVGRGICQ